MMVTSKEENNMNEDNNNNFILVDEDKPKEVEENHKDFTRCCHRMFLCDEWLCIL